MEQAMERELEMLKWFLTKISKIASFETEVILSLVITEQICYFIGYDKDGDGIVHLHGKDAEIVGAICKYLEIPRKE